MADDDAILSVRDLIVDVEAPEGSARIVDGVSFDVRAHEVFGIVGESGSGKSVTMLAIMGLLPANVRIVGGRVLFRGQDLRTLSSEAFRRLRGARLGMIFQDPMTSLNPVIRVGTQIAEALRIHRPDIGSRQVEARVFELLELVGIPNAQRRYRQYPHEFSGGMRQRAMIAMAIANDPDLLIADEPTTALDVTIQAQIMELLAVVRARTGASMVLITHDLGLVAETADRIAVMYGGRIVETAAAGILFGAPRHPYTVGLLRSLPELHQPDDSLYSIPGQPPSVQDRPSGCVFHPRCGLSDGRLRCREQQPELLPAGAPSQLAACHFSDETRQWESSSIRRAGESSEEARP